MNKKYIISYEKLKELLDSFILHTDSKYGKIIRNNLNIDDYIKLIPNDYYHITELINKYKDEEDPLLKAFIESVK